MILFDLKCENCNSVEFDVFCKFDEIKEVSCKNCGNKNMKALVSLGGFELKYDPKKDICGWSWDNYAATQYNREVNAANEEAGKIVSGPSYSGKSHVYKAGNEN